MMNPLLAESGPFDLFVPILAILVFVALLVGVFMLLRKRYMQDDGTEATGGFSIGGLRDLVKQGKMTQQEYDAAKAKIVAAAHRHQAEKAAEAEAKRKTPQPPFSLE